MKTAHKDRNLSILLILPAFTLAEIFLGFLYRAPSPPVPHYMPMPWVNRVHMVLFLGNLIASIAVIIWLKGFRHLAILITGGNLAVNLIVTLLTAFMIAGVGF